MRSVAEAIHARSLAALESTRGLRDDAFLTTHTRSSMTPSFWADASVRDRPSLLCPSFS
jgi:hypothetical protein